VNPKISVIFPVGDRMAFLPEALESILNQSFQDFELLAVLDGVSEPVRDLVTSYQDTRIKIIELPVHLAESAARNAGLVVAEAPYVAWMDSDDFAMIDRFKCQYEWMQAHPDVTVCGSNSVKQLKDGRKVAMQYPETDGMIKSRLLLVDSAVLNPTAMFRTGFVRQHHLFYDANFKRDGDHRFFVEMMRMGARFYGIQEQLLLYRRHPGNLTQDQTGFDLYKTRVREIILPVYFPTLTGEEYAVLLKGMQKEVHMTFDEACLFVAAANKAARENRSFKGEDRQELRRILAMFYQRVVNTLQKK
jgi:glycosyltransferase involved in cell wall biosynthesis